MGGWYGAILAVGAGVGSFLNVVLVRTHTGESSICGRSHCQHCRATLRAQDMIPVVSFFLLRGRCRDCGARISAWYPTVELVTAVLALVFVILSPTVPLLVRNLALLPFLILIFVYDVRHQLIPDRFSVPAIVLAFLLNPFVGMSWTDTLLGAVAVGGFFLLQYALSHGTWIGGGDIRLGVLMGTLLGWKEGLFALALAYMMGAVFAVYLLASKRATPKTPLPFGGFLVASTLVVLLFGKPLLAWYLGGWF